MATTSTYETLREAQEELIEALTPDSFASVPFMRYRGESDFRTWASEHHTACMRRFWVRDLFDYDYPEIAAYDVEWTVGRCEVVTAYPTTGRYGQDNSADLQDVIREDMHSIEEAIGARAGRYANAHAVLQSTEVETDEDVTFLSMTYTFRYYRSVS